MRVLSKFRHPNLVILMGFARHGPDCSEALNGFPEPPPNNTCAGPSGFLIYEHLAGGDVFRRLQRCAQDNVPKTQRPMPGGSASFGGGGELG